ncbi:protein kinase [Salinisphaera sp. PC39]|uniref:serine/threonine-protein kinase n=1 Tax=Salinisphaera sp. PC39 TaxID=1304156 RepID=UPI0033403C64
MTDDDAGKPGRKGGDRTDEPTERTDADAPTEFTDPGGDAPTELTDTGEDAPTEITGTTGDEAATEVSRPAGGSGAAAGGAGPLADLRPGYMLKERFRLEEKLGAGAMGAVFRAVDQRRVETRHQNPNVAIKVIAGDFSKHANAFIALQREADKSQTLAHPNIITVYDFDRDGELFFMTMESLVGTTLDKYIAEGRGDRKQALAYIGDIANAIAYAHRRNIVHSDLKPQNIFVTEEGTLKVLDFGIARAFSDADEGGDRTRDPGEVAGLTPTYASCEMFEGGEPHPADDVYAIGLIAYEMLTGEHPFARKRAVDAKAEGLRPRRIRGLKNFQWQAIAKALAFDRADRWQDAEQFRRKFVGTGRRVRQLSAALVLAIAGFGTYMLFFQPEAGPDIPFEELPQETRQEFNTALAEGQRARQFGDLNGALFYFDQAYNLHPRNPRVMEEIDAVLDDIFSRMADDPSPAQARRQLNQVRELQKYESLKQNSRLAEKERELAALAGGSAAAE